MSNVDNQNKVLPTMNNSLV